LAAIVAFGAMIFFHELGHFLIARRTGVRIHAFAMGFGPQLFGWKRGETQYSLNLLPFGGYVRMEGEDNETESGPGSFRSRPLGARMAIISAGPLMNLLLAVLILAIAALTGGVPTGAPSTRVGVVEDNWPAAQAGLKPGDEIVAIDGKAVTSGDQIIETIHSSAGRNLKLTVRRGTQTFVVAVTPRLDDQRKVGRIGFSPQSIFERLDPPSAFLYGFQQTGRYIVTLGESVASLIQHGEFTQNLGGPLAAGRLLVQAAESGVQTFLHLAAFLSIVIGIFNLLPIPALDGGRLAFLLVEMVRRRPVDPRREGWVHMVGFALLLLLLFFLTVRDVRRLLGTGG
jgi:regulator of sigma E protease